MKDAQCNSFDDQTGISKLMTNEFQKRFKAEVKTNQLQSIPLSREINEANNKLLTREVTDEEIYEVVKQIHTLKAPSPNGMQAVSYQNRWNIITKSMCNMVRSFFNSGYVKRD